jgi:hypothetical protein
MYSINRVKSVYKLQILTSKLIQHIVTIQSPKNGN